MISLPVPADTSKMKIAIYILLFGTLLTATTAQPPDATPTEGPPTQLEILTPEFLPINEAATSLFGPDVIGIQTPILIRYVTLFSLASYEPTAACYPTALSFFGVRDKIDPSLCNPLSMIKIFHYIFYRLVEQEFAGLEVPIAAFLNENGLTPDNRSTDVSTEIGWANTIALRAQKYFATDGWNSLGDLNRKDFRLPYSDFTGYKPVNLAEKPVSSLRRPLRWQPLVLPVSRVGEFKAQVHVIPHMGDAKLMALTEADLAARVSKSPYKEPNRRDTLGKADRDIMERLIRKFFRVSRQLTPEQRFEAAFWENKLFSLGGFLTIYRQALNLDNFTVMQWFMSEMVAQYDAVIVAWREKRRHDLVRPTTIIRKLWKGRKVSAFVSQEKGVQRVLAEEFEPLVPTQPHSEYPSGSALICTASLENLQAAVDKKFGKNFTGPPYVLPVRPGMFQFLPDVGKSFNLTYTTLSEAARSCGLSRLYAGVHFAPSVNEGLRLGKGIGRRAFEQMDDLARGVVPDNCGRCLRGDD